MANKKLEINCSAKDYLELDDIINFQGELKDLSKANYKRLEKSISDNGFCSPFHIWEDKGKFYCLDGTQRTRVLITLRKKGWVIPKLPVTFIKAKTKKQAKKILLSLTSQYGNMTRQGLYQFMMDAELEMDEVEESFNFPEIEFASFRSEFFDKEPGNDPDEDKVESPEAVRNPVIKNGDLIELGRHRLICGDATKPEDYSILMGKEKANLILTDPPYNVDYIGKTKDKLKIKNDKMNDLDFFNFLSVFYTNCMTFIEGGSSIYVFHPDREIVNFFKAMTKAGFKYNQILIWVKNSLVMSRKHYHYMHEPILYGSAPGNKKRWFSDHKQTTVLYFDRPTRSTEHPTMKPIKLFRYLINNSTQKGEIVLDPFSGAGTSLIAADKADRVAYCMEIDPVYCDVIIDRWCQVTGEREVKINGEISTWQFIASRNKEVMH